MSDLTTARKQAWKTRREKYGEQGHRGLPQTYTRHRVAEMAPDAWGMLNLIVRLHAEGVLSEGQTTKATGLDRIEIRRLTDEFLSGPSGFMSPDECASRGLEAYAIYGGKVHSFKDKSGRVIGHGTPMYRLAFAQPRGAA